MKLWKLAPLCIVAAAASPAAATVSLIAIGANSQTDLTIGNVGSFQTGPAAQSTSFADPYQGSTSDQSRSGPFDAAGQLDIATSAGSAVRLNSLTDIDFFVRASVKGDSTPFVLGTDGVARSSAYYTFSIDTVSTVSFSINTAPVSASDVSYVDADLYSIGRAGGDIYYREGVAAGYIAPSYQLDPGIYAILISAYGEGGTPDLSRFPGLANIQTSAVANVMIDSPAAGVSDVPEPASWALMVAGFGMVGGGLRRRRQTAHAGA